MCACNTVDVGGIYSIDNLLLFAVIPSDLQA